MDAEKLAKRLLSKVDKVSSPLGCWLWTASVSCSGYGEIGINGLLRKAHRLSHFLATGEAPEVVSHQCDVKLCVNPDHLRGCTQAENMREASERRISRPAPKSRNPKIKELFKSEAYKAARTYEERLKMRLLVSVDKNAEGGCWIWLGGLEDNGYGMASVRSKTVRAHRLSHFLATGELPPIVCHSCDVRACVNPDHLTGGTQEDNMRERSERGRLKLPVGLTAEQKSEMRRMVEETKMPYAEIGRKFGLTSAQVRKLAPRTSRNGRSIFDKFDPFAKVSALTDDK